MKALRLAVAATLVLGMTFAPTAIAEAGATHTFAVDRATCAMLLRAYHLHGRDTGCVATVRMTPTGVATASAATTCRGYWQDFWIGNPIAGAAGLVIDHVNVGLCWDGTHVWRKWGADCYTQTSIVLASAIPWCGVYNNGGSYVEPGDNFGLAAYIAPWYWRDGYFRYRVNRYGSLTAIWGSCCS